MTVAQIQKYDKNCGILEMRKIFFVKIVIKLSKHAKLCSNLNIISDVVFIIYQHCYTKSDESESTIGRFYVRNKEFVLRKAAQYYDSKLFHRFLEASKSCLQIDIAPIKERLLSRNKKFVLRKAAQYDDSKLFHRFL